MTRAAPVVVGPDRGDDGERGMDGDGSRRRIRPDGSRGEQHGDEK